MICCICLLNYSSLNPPMEINHCKHYFHEGCIKLWNTECGVQSLNFTCPECKVEFKIGDLQIRADGLSQIIKNTLQIVIKLRLLDASIIDIQFNSQKLLSDLYKIAAVYVGQDIHDIKLSVMGKILHLESDGNRNVLDVNITNGQEVSIINQRGFQVFVKNLNGQNRTVDVHDNFKQMENQPISSLYCPCCLEAFNEQQQLVEIMVCNHYFHQNCINQWLKECIDNQKTARCPSCREFFEQSNLRIRNDILQLILDNTLDINFKVILLNGQSLNILLSSQRTLNDLYSILTIHTQLQNHEFQLLFKNKKYNHAKDGHRTLMDLQIRSGQTLSLNVGNTFEIFLKPSKGNVQIFEASRRMKVLQFIILFSQFVEAKVDQCHFWFGTQKFNSNFKWNKSMGDLGFLLGYTYVFSQQKSGFYLNQANRVDIWHIKQV